jgi:hypothetical protein
MVRLIMVINGHGGEINGEIINGEILVRYTINNYRSVSHQYLTGISPVSHGLAPPVSHQYLASVRYCEILV